MFCVSSLDKKYNEVLNYVFQTLLLQMANSDQADIGSNDELVIGASFEKGIRFQHECHLVRFYRQILSGRPFVLIDNAVSIFSTPPIGDDTEYSISHIMPISPYFLLFWGSRRQLAFFLSSKQNPHAINIYRVLVEDKKCSVASQNEQYIKWFAKEYPYYQFDPFSGAIPKTRREFI